MNKVLRFLNYLNETGKKTWIRTVVVPGINDDERAISEYVRVISPLKNVVKYELLAFHTMGFFKYERLRICNPLADTPPLKQEKLAELQAFADGLLKLK